MRWSLVGYGLSVGIHLAVGGSVWRIPKSVATRSTTIAVFDSKQQNKKSKTEPKPEEDKPRPPPRESKPILAPRAAAPAPAENTPPAAAHSPTPAQAAAHPALAAMPDFGLSLGGLAVGGPGIAVPTGGGSPASAGGGTATRETKQKVFAAKPKTSEVDEAELGELIKAKQLETVRPQYPDEARSAEIEGKVRVEVTIGVDGSVTAARVLSGLGHGCDEAALAAAKRWKFAPATRGGRPVESQLIISVAFRLTE